MSAYGPDDRVLVSPRYMAGAGDRLADAIGLRTATDTARDLAAGLDEVCPAFAAAHAPSTAPAPPSPAGHRAPTPRR
ncbi:hypothetical protein [Streptomyces sp. NPDC087294]|uniref:hypothetical protein n=1 Tax=Streptomyces sp. NPDC087294 TaxID=3365777 RepID=UPI0037F52991